VLDTLKLNGVLPYYNKTAAEKSTAVEEENWDLAFNLVKKHRTFLHARFGD